jgi:3-deoxy-D-manno-octulosonate 8-phosphate phosphatase (KDO 8-P phosphatase)
LFDVELKQKAEKIKLLILDVDGVMTGGQIILDNNGNELKMFHVRDGHGIKMLQRAGIKVALITGRDSKVVTLRARELGIEDVRQGAKDKLAVYRELMKSLGLSDEDAAYVGDDIVDLPVMRVVGLSFAVADAETYVRDAAHVVTSRKGGEGAVREAVDFLLRASGLWESVTAEYFS